MKQTMKNAVIALFTIIAMSAGFTANANTPDSAPTPQMKMVGRTVNDPVFQLNINNSQYGKFVVVVKDEYGYILHTEVLAGVNAQRMYQLNIEDLGGVGVRFEVYNEKNERTTAFTIVNNQTVVQETAVAKLK